MHSRLNYQLNAHNHSTQSIYSCPLFNGFKKVARVWRRTLTISWDVQFNKIFEILDVGWQLVYFIVAEAEFSKAV